MVTLSETPTIAMALVMTGAVFVAGFLVLAGMETSTAIDDGCASTTSEGEAYVANMTAGLSNVIDYAPTFSEGC